MVTELLFRAGFTVLVVLVGLDRLAEVRKSNEHERVLRLRGAREHAAWQMPIMRAVHAGWLVGMIAEVWLLSRAPIAIVALPALGTFLGGRALRRAAIRALGPRWNVKILTLRGEPPVQDGIFGTLRHPNYLGVVLEIAALPLVGGAYVTSIVASAANALLLRSRIRAEEAALRDASDYSEMSRRPLLIPRADDGTHAR